MDASGAEDAVSSDEIMFWARMRSTCRRSGDNYFKSDVAILGPGQINGEENVNVHVGVLKDRQYDSDLPDEYGVTSFKMPKNVYLNYKECRNYACLHVLGKPSDDISLTNKTIEIYRVL